MQTLHNPHSNPEDRNQADIFLKETFFRQDECWNVLFQILQQSGLPTEVYFFAAQFLRTKVSMKFKHNKKWNTAFVFESLVREVVKSIIAEDLKKKNVVVATIKKFFNKNTELYKELQIYKSILEARNMEPQMKEKMYKAIELET